MILANSLENTYITPISCLIKTLWPLLKLRFLLILVLGNYSFEEIESLEVVLVGIRCYHVDHVVAQLADEEEFLVRAHVVCEAWEKFLSPWSVSIAIWYIEFTFADWINESRVARHWLVIFWDRNVKDISLGFIIFKDFCVSIEVQQGGIYYEKSEALINFRELLSKLCQIYQLTISGVFAVWNK